MMIFLWWKTNDKIVEMVLEGFLGRWQKLRTEGWWWGARLKNERRAHPPLLSMQHTNWIKETFPFAQKNLVFTVLSRLLSSKQLLSQKFYLLIGLYWLCCHNYANCKSKFLQNGSLLWKLTSVLWKKFQKATC
jgi:hypothetical protein